VEGRGGGTSGSDDCIGAAGAEVVDIAGGATVFVSEDTDADNVNLTVDVIGACVVWGVEFGVFEVVGAVVVPICCAVDSFGGSCAIVVDDNIDMIKTDARVLKLAFILSEL